MSLDIERINFTRLLKCTERLIINSQKESLNNNINNIKDDNLFFEIDANLGLLEKNFKRFTESAARKTQKEIAQLENSAYRSKIDNLNELFLQIKLKKSEQENKENLGNENNKVIPIKKRKPRRKSRKERDLDGELDGADNNLYTEEILLHHRLLQEKLTTDILMIANHLRDTSEESYNILKKDNVVLDKVDEEMDKNIDKIKEENDRLEKLRKQASLYSYISNIILMIVAFSFVLMYMFIKVT